MLSQAISSSPTRTIAGRAQQTDAINAAIKKHLRIHRKATTRELAVTCGLTAASIHRRMLELRELGEVRDAPREHSGNARNGAPVRVWALGLDPIVALEHKQRCTWSKAEQLDVRRDPLVAALFGAGRAQEVRA
jgi:hypothetical protein